MTSDVFSTFIWRRSLSGRVSPSYLAASFASLTLASMASWLMRALGDFFQRRLKGMGSTVSEAFVTSSLVFCVGPLTILGSLDNGLVGDPTKLVIKSTLDGFAALAFGATLGWGVLLSVFTVLIFQGAISLGAGALAPVLGSGSEALIELTATGGLILIAIGLRLLKIRELRTANFLPALVVAPLLVGAVALWQMYANGTLVWPFH
jgi:uncharacterized membrane protein YqgA involved in biofilm formation